jgi:type III secretion protein J
VGISNRFVLALAVLVCGCQAELASGLSENDANAMIVALDRAGIGATKETEAGSDPPAYVVRVGPDDVADALAVVRAEGLPRSVEPGVAEVFGEGSLVPTPTEERARFVAATSGEIARSIESIDGVLDARVHIALADTSSLVFDAPRPPPRASVLVRYRGDVAPYDESAVRRLVAGAVDGLDEASIAVVGVATPAAPPVSERMTHLGPISVTRGSATTLKLVLGGMLGSNLVLAAVLAVVLTRRRQKAEADAEAERSPKKKAA